MRNVRRNLKHIYYRKRIRISEPEIDKYGNKIYFKDGDIIEYEMPISIGIESGNWSIMPFGNSPSYDRSMVTTDMECPIDEHTVLWIDIDPNEESYNYIVKNKLSSINEIKYTLKKVDTDEG